MFKDDYETWEYLATDGTNNLHISEFSKHQIILVKERAEERELPHFFVAITT
jgi:hypothetical protein